MPQYGVLDCYHGIYWDVTTIGFESIEQEEQGSYTMLLPEEKKSVQMRNYNQIFMVAVTHKQELFYSEFKEMWPPLPCFLYLLCVWGKHFQRYLDSAYFNKAAHME